MESGLTLTVDMMLVLTVLAVTILMFVFEVLRVDVVAITIMVILGLLGLVPAAQLFDGFASNAVLSIIAVMILGAGLDRTGVMTVVAALDIQGGWQHRPPHHPAYLGHRRLYFRDHAERGRHGAVSAGGVEKFRTNRNCAVQTADAHGLLRHHGGHPDHGGFLTADPAQ